MLINAVCRATVAALEEQERAKRAKHETACELSGEYAFIPFVVDNCGNLSPDTSSLLARLLGKTAWSAQSDAWHCYSCLCLEMRTLCRATWCRPSFTSSSSSSTVVIVVVLVLISYYYNIIWHCPICTDSCTVFLVLSSCYNWWLRASVPVQFSIFRRCRQRNFVKQRGHGNSIIVVSRCGCPVLSSIHTVFHCKWGSNNLLHCHRFLLPFHIKETHTRPPQAST